MSTPLPVYQSAGRTRASDVPKLLVKPTRQGRTARTHCGSTSSVTGSGPDRLVARAARSGWPRDLARHRGAGGYRSAGDRWRCFARGSCPSAPGASRLGGSGQDPGRRAPAPFLVSFRINWRLPLRADDQPVALFSSARTGWTSCATRPRTSAPTVWREFYKATDPIEITSGETRRWTGTSAAFRWEPRFRESGDPAGWTDRGEVFITLASSPTTVFDVRDGRVARGGVARRALDPPNGDAADTRFFRIIRDSAAPA